jgi:hypothetical protein
LLKFRQIITSLLDFCIKSTESIDINITTDFIKETVGYMIKFKLSFIPKFEFKQEELKLLFENHDLFKNQQKIERNVGLPILVISKLVHFLGGSFSDIKSVTGGRIYMTFSLPFSATKSSQMMVRTPRIKLASNKQQVSS